MNRQTRLLPAELEKQVRRTLEEWAATGKVRRLWARDATLWTGADEASWLGWLGIARDQVGRVDDLRRLAEDVRREGFTRALLLGMGGSSLAPEVLKETFGRLDGFPEVLVLDSTDPAQVKALERKVDLAKTFFIVSSKSGTTLEPNLFKEYFLERARQVVGAERAGGQFIAITDPGSRLQGLAEADRFRRVFSGEPSIGGRYSALSNFGMVPAEVRERGVPPADRRLAGEDPAEPIGFGEPLEPRAWIGDGDELAARALRADDLASALQKVLLEEVRLQRGPRLGRDDEERLREVYLPLECLDLGGIGGVEHEHFGESVEPAECLLQ